jgi:hypothetical protein
MQDSTVQNSVMKAESSFAPVARVLNAVALPAFIFVGVGSPNIVERPTLRIVVAVLITWTLWRLYVALRYDGGHQHPVYRFWTLKVLAWVFVAALVNGALRAFS